MSEGSAAPPLPRPPQIGHKIRVGQAPGVRRRALLHTVLLIGIPLSIVIASIAAYLLISSPRTPCAPLVRTSTSPKPPVVFSGVDLHSWNASVSIVSAYVCEPPSYYRVSLVVGQSRGSSAPLAPSGSFSSVTVNGTPYRIEWADTTGDQIVDVSDTFQVSGDGVRLATAPIPGSILEYQFLLLVASDGGHLGTAAWALPYLPPPPIVSFGTPSQSGGNTTLNVLNVSRPYDPSNYWVNLAAGSDLGIPTTMPAVSGGGGSRAPVNGTMYRIPWIDADASGTVSAGDSFLVTGDGAALPASTAFTFYLLWTDQSLVSAVSWTT